MGSSTGTLLAVIRSFQRVSDTQIHHGFILLQCVLLIPLLATVFGAAWTDPDSPVFSAYQEWRNASTITYTHSTLLGSDDDVVVHWTIDDNMLYLGVVAAAGGWVGFGVADAGRMIGADIVVAVDEQCYY